MCRAISIMKQRVRQELFEEYRLQQRIQQRADEAGEEIVFDFADRQLDPELPVLHNGQLVVYPWGNRGGTGRSRTAFARSCAAQGRRRGDRGCG